MNAHNPANGSIGRQLPFLPREWFDIFSGARHLRLLQVLPGVRLRRSHQPRDSRHQVMTLFLPRV
jgi:hypothetical protein